MEPGRSLLARTARAASRRELAGSVPGGNAGRATPGRQRQVPHWLTAAIRRLHSEPPEPIRSGVLCPASPLAFCHVDTQTNAQPIARMDPWDLPQDALDGPTQTQWAFAPSSPR